MDTSSLAYIKTNLKHIDLTIQLRLEMSQLRIGQSALLDGLKELCGELQMLPAWKLGIRTEAENKRARIDTLEQRNSVLEKQATALKLKIGNDSTNIETTPTPKRQCVGLSITKKRASWQSVLFPS